MKNSKKVLTIFALSFGSFCSASLQASPENPLIKNKVPSVVKEPALDNLNIDYNDPICIEMVQSLLDNGELSWEDLSPIGMERLANYNDPGQAGFIDFHLRNGELSWEDLSPIGKGRFADYNNPMQVAKVKLYLDEGKVSWEDLSLIGKGRFADYNNQTQVAKVKSYLDKGELSWNNLSFAGKLRLFNYEHPTQVAEIKSYLDEGELSWGDLWITGKARFFEYCPSDKLEFFQSLGDAEKIIALRYYDPTYHKDFLTYWDEANDNVRGAVFHRVKGVIAFRYKLWRTLSPKERLRNIESLFFSQPGGVSEDVSYLWEAWDWLDNQSKAEKFGDFIKGCEYVFMVKTPSGGGSHQMPLEGTTIIWDAWVQLSDDAKASHFGSLCKCLNDKRKYQSYVLNTAKGERISNTYRITYDHDMKEIAYVYDDLYEKGYRTYFNEDSENEESLFSVLPDAAKELLFKPFLSNREGNKESAKWDFIEAYKLNEDEEDLVFIDYIKEDPDA